MTTPDQCGRFQVVVCASGGGGNFQALIDAQRTANFEIVLLVVDRECGAIERAGIAGIPVAQPPGNLSKAEISGWTMSVLPREADLIVLAGFMPILSAAVCRQWARKIINTHPSLLPKYGGIGMHGTRVQEAVLLAGEKQAGCTIHYVTEQVDGGEIILQSAIDIDPGDTPWSLGGRVFKEENRLLVEAVRTIAGRQQPKGAQDAI